MEATLFAWLRRRSCASLRTPCARETLAATEELFGLLIARINGIQNAGTLSRYALYKRLSVPLFRQFLDEEPRRAATGRYVYLHVILPHPPFVWSADCTYVEPSSYREQTLCATRLMAEMVDTLKRLGRYDDSLVIFQSDHGYHGVRGGKTEPASTPPVAVRESVRTAMSYLGVGGYFRRIHPLLTIKPAAAGERPLQRASVPVQLIDIPATVVDLTGIPAPVTDGTSAFRLSGSEAREIHLYAGVYTKDARGRVLVLGKSMSQTDLAHISYTAGTGWKLYPNLPARAD